MDTMITLGALVAPFIYLVVKFGFPGLVLDVVLIGIIMKMYALKDEQDRLEKRIEELKKE